MKRKIHPALRLPLINIPQDRETYCVGSVIQCHDKRLLMWCKIMFTWLLGELCCPPSWHSSAHHSLYPPSHYLIPLGLSLFFPLAFYLLWLSLLQCWKCRTLGCNAFLCHRGSHWATWSDAQNKTHSLWVQLFYHRATCPGLWNT